jgi:hypothetical protein
MSRLRRFAASACQARLEIAEALARGARLRTLALLCLLVASPAAGGERYALIITGASGGDQYAEKYATWRVSVVSTLRETFGYTQDRLFVLAEEESDGAQKATREQVRRVLGALARRITKDDQLLVLLIGHGTSLDGDEAKFNLVGPDLSASQWADLVKPIPGRLVFVNATGASFPFLRKLAGRNRVILTATDSAAQQFETVFPEYFVKAFADGAADADKNGRVSMWEAFTYASAGVRNWFAQKGQLPTERPLLDDTGAGIGREAGTPGTDGAVARVTYVEPEAPLALPSDAATAALVRRRADLERRLEELKARKEMMAPGQYEADLESLLVEIARLSAQIRAKA